MKRYRGIQSSELEQLRAELQRYGVNAPPGDDVELEGPHGVVLGAKYDRGREILTITIVRKPFWLPAGKIWELVDQAIEHFAS